MQIRKQYQILPFDRPRRRKTSYPRERVQVSGRRYYSPAMGRFVSHDPLDEESFFVNQAGDLDFSALGDSEVLNPYCFVLNSPINRHDYLGLKTDCCDGKPYDTSTHCCCNDEVKKRDKVSTGVKTCFLWLNKGSLKFAHTWMEFPGGSCGYGPPGKVMMPDKYAKNPKKSCSDVKLDPCEVDIDKYIRCLKAQCQSKSQPPYDKRKHNCWHWRKNQMKGCKGISKCQ